jgi:hypothetical protein
MLSTRTMKTSMLTSNATMLSTGAMMASLLGKTGTSTMMSATTSMAMMPSTHTLRATMARYLCAQRPPCPGASVGSDGYAQADERYPLPAWAQHCVVRVDHSLARWNRL